LQFFKDAIIGKGIIVDDIAAVVPLSFELVAAVVDLRFVVARPLQVACGSSRLAGEYLVDIQIVENIIAGIKFAHF